jgi:hypothetical protein
MTMEEFTPTAPHVYTAIAEVTGRLAKVGISKDRKNTTQGYKFRGIDDVYNALSAEIAAARLCLLPRVTSREITERETKNGGVLFYVVAGVDFDLVSAVDGSSHTVHVIGEAMDSGDKATNKAMSAAYKYMAMQVFCIPTEGDHDADSTTHEGIKPGIGVHSPYGDLDPRVDGLAHRYADAFRAAMTPEDAHQVQSDLNDERDEKGESWGEILKLSVWSKLDSTNRARIKRLLAQKEAA